MKVVLLLACSVVVGCGVIFGLVHGIVPHLVSPELFPKAQARESQGNGLENTIAGAGGAVRAGAGVRPDAFVAATR